MIAGLTMPDDPHERVRLHEDGKCRCPWCGTDPLYVHYHDTDWGVPEYDSRALFEKLLLDGFQAGLSWITILRKRENFRAAFDGFEPEIMARYDARKACGLMQDAGIVRNRLKIEAAVTNAQAYLAMPDFSAYLWGFLDGKPMQNSFRSMAAIAGARRRWRRKSRKT
jgi:DNA-3-methyladenine glycosylase I